MGAEVDTYSTFRPSPKSISAEAMPLVESTLYLYEVPKLQVVWATASYAFRAPLRFLRGLARLIRDLTTAEVSNPGDRVKMIWHFCTGCLLASKLRAAGTKHLHAHFAHVPTAIAMHGAGLAGISYSFTAHANDIFERPTALREKVARSGFVACISDYNRRFLTERGCDPDKQVIVRCALDVTKYGFRERNIDKERPMLYSVGRLVEKKGIGVLIDALALLKSRGRAFSCRVVGDGPLLEPLRCQVIECGLSDDIEMMGGQPQETVKALFDEADVFVLPCVVAASGDRDGIPVVLMEAMALGVPVVSTTVSGIPELIRSGHNGLLVTPGDVDGLAQALGRLLGNPSETQSFAREARRTIETEFEAKHNAAILWEKMNECIGTGR